MNSLVLKLTRRADNSAELHASLKYSGFEGFGSCFLDVADFDKRAQCFALFPLPGDGSVCVEGGYLQDDMSGLAETHLHISALPEGSLGKIALRIELATPDDRNISEFQAKLSCVIPATYEQLKNLSEAMIALANGHGDEYTIEL